MTKEKLEKTNFPYEEVKHMIIHDFKKKDFEDFVIKLKAVLEKILREIE